MFSIFSDGKIKITVSIILIVNLVQRLWVVAGVVLFAPLEAIMDQKIQVLIVLSGNGKQISVKVLVILLLVMSEICTVETSILVVDAQFKEIQMKTKDVVGVPNLKFYI